MKLIKLLLYKYLPYKNIAFYKRHYFTYKLKNAKITEEEDLILLEKLIEKNSTAFDIGANYGLYTKFLSRFVGQKGNVYSFEPILETFNYLNNNINKLKYRNVVPFNLALSDKIGKANMQIPKINQMILNYYEASIIEKPTDKTLCYEVETITLDTFCAQKQLVPNFIKCDVEGHEWQVFKGAEIIISKYKPLLFIEINEEIENNKTETDCLLKLLFSLGYQIYININGKLKIRETEKKFNYYFLTPQHALKFSEFII